MKQVFRKIYTDDENLEQIQNNVSHALIENYKFFGVPSFENTTSVIAKFSLITLLNPILGEISVVLQETTKKDIGKIIVVKNVSSSTNKIKVISFDGNIDSENEYIIEEEYGSALFVCIDKNKWVSSRSSD